MSLVKKPAWLLGYSLNVYSQSGEDGIVPEILSLLPETDKWCTEFGASDGIFCSNTRNLITHYGYSAILIESDKEAFERLKGNCNSFRDVVPIHGLVGFKGSQRLDYILSKTEIPENFDFLSIDVDGNEYHIWKAMQVYRPKVICIEYNPSIPTEVRFVQPAGVNVTQGSSLQSLVDLGKDKGYELICVTEYNAFFIKSEYYNRYDIADNSPYQLRKDLSHVMYVFPGYDGHLFLRGCTKLHEHLLELKESDIQVIPKFLQKWSGKYGFWEKLFFLWYLWRGNSKAFWEVMKRKRR